MEVEGGGCVWVGSFVTLIIACITRTLLITSVSNTALKILNLLECSLICCTRGIQTDADGLMVWRRLTGMI